MYQLPSAFEFQTSVETIRAHHWRCYTDTYMGCEFSCQFCLYKGPGEYGRHVRPAQGAVEARGDLGIVDVGTTTDPYQSLEEKYRITRSILEAAIATEMPLFILTRGDLVLRDVDLLRELASAGLVEVCVSVITLNEHVAKRIEPYAPPPSARVRLVEQLAAEDIPVSFHVAPLIPGLDTQADLYALGKRLAEACGSHVFSAMLGARKPFWESFYKSMDDVAGYCGSFETFQSAYPLDFDFSPDAANTCGIEQALPTLEPFRDGVTEGGAIYVSENYPYLTTGALEGGIYRWKLPTVYDMAEWIQSTGSRTTWEDFVGWYQNFQPSTGLLETVRSLWQSGELFAGTYLSKVSDDYVVSGELMMPATRTLVAKRNPVR